MTLTKYTTRCFIAVPAAHQQAANDVCESVVKGGRGTFTVQWPPQDETGKVVPKFYLCDWQMLPEERTALAAAFGKAGVQATFYDRDDWDPVKCVTVTYATVDADLTTKTLPKAPSLVVQGAALSDLTVASKTKLLARSWWKRLLVWLMKVWWSLLRKKV